MRGETYAGRILEAMESFAEKPALRWKEKEEWKEISYAALREKVLNLAAAFKKFGIQPQDRVGIWLETSPPWIFADLALQVVGAVTVTVYPTLTGAQAAAILKDAGAKALLSNASRLALLEDKNILGTLIRLEISVDPRERGLLFEKFLEEGENLRRENPAFHLSKDRLPAGADDLSAIIYTSGTTGEPKGVMLSHRNVLSNAEGIIPCFMPQGGHVTLLHLPLAHVMARNTTVATNLLTGSLLALAEPEREKLPQNLKEVAPTAFITVPYLLDKFRSAIQEAFAHRDPFSKFLLEQALKRGRRERVGRLEKTGRFSPDRASLPFLFWDRLFLKKIRAKLGGRLQMIVIGGSNSNRESMEFFWGLGIPVYEGYGSTEVTNCATFTWSGDVKLGTVGRAAPNMEFKLAPDGEVLVRGGNVMKGYWNRPEASREILDEEGWLHMGDIGEVDGEGYLKIIERKKELFALSTGKKVAPQVVENALKLSPCIAHVCGIGDGRKYMTALIVPDLKAVQKRLGLAEATSIENPQVKELLRSEIHRAMKELAPFEKIKRFYLIEAPFTVENNLMTPTLKLRRKQIAERFRREIEELYRDSSSEAVEI